ncbi:hypothetical protein GCM10012287_03090 [Streptomyces daqingensis]|uniref:Helix-turn-helix domain-containing protein n=1 Tax=Streptomyces daqingensis TaxID=1472640 RepID=A0ABQ2LUB7_9ACTN|nr:hypothetical protein GCM10012287_03090 [Streptomyces daqingensis]
MDFEVRRDRKPQGRRKLTREQAAYFQLMQRGYSSEEARRIVGIDVRTGKKWRNGSHARGTHLSVHTREEPGPRRRRAQQPPTQDARLGNPSRASVLNFSRPDQHDQVLQRPLEFARREGPFPRACRCDLSALPRTSARPSGAP